MLLPQYITESVLSPGEAHDAIVASCTCCGASYTADGWERLEQLKSLHVPACPQVDDKPAYDVLLANCPCGSTLGWELPFCECGAEADHAEQ